VRGLYRPDPRRTRFGRSASRDSPLFERSSPATEIKTGAQAREIAEPLLGPTQRPPEAASSDNAGDPRLPDVRLTGIVIEPDRRIAIFAVNGINISRAH
jgi:hypothetical protein